MNNEELTRLKDFCCEAIAELDRGAMGQRFRKNAKAAFGYLMDATILGMGDEARRRLLVEAVDAYYDVHITKRHEAAEGEFYRRYMQVIYLAREWRLALDAVAAASSHLMCVVDAARKAKPRDQE